MDNYVFYPTIEENGNKVIKVELHGVSTASEKILKYLITNYKNFKMVPLNSFVKNVYYTLVPIELESDDSEIDKLKNNLEEFLKKNSLENSWKYFIEEKNKK